MNKRTTLFLIRPKLLTSWGILHIIIQIHTFKHKTEISDHENIGIDTLLMVIACTDMQISTIIGFSVMAALIKGFQIQSHIPDPASNIFFMIWGGGGGGGVKPRQKMESIHVALFT